MNDDPDRRRRSVLAGLAGALASGLVGPRRAWAAGPGEPLARARVSLTQATRSLVLPDGSRVQFADSGGANPVVICLHAVGHGSGDYAAVYAALALEFRVICLDWPNHGRSADSSALPTVASYARVLAAFMAALSIQRCALVGNSIGGGVALRYAAQHPEQVWAVAVANPAGLDEGGWLARIFLWWMQTRFRTAKTDPTAFSSWFADYYQSLLSEPPAAAQRAHIVAAGEQMAPMLERAWAGFAQPENDTREDAARIVAPVFVAWADKDRSVRWSRNEEAVLRMPRHCVRFFPAGHMPFLETPDTAVPLLRTFLSSPVRFIDDCAAVAAATR